MERGYRSYILLACLACICTLSAGCLSGFSGPAPTHATTIPVTVTSPAPESPVATLPAAEMALQADDLPADYILRDRTAIAYAGVSPIFRDLGWRQGYGVSFYRLDKEMDDMTSVTQEIHIYPLENMNEVYSLEKDALLPQDDSATDYQVPFPQQGDRSVAWREIHTGAYGTTVTYSVIFTRKNVYEQISMTGTTTDYETLKAIARNAVTKIR